LRVGFDIGGTFTDLVLDDRKRTWIHKVLTTPRRPAEGALRGLDELLAVASVAWTDIEEVVHGTTLVTNAIIERAGVPTGLITTRGFRDVLEMGRQQRYDAYDLRLRFPAPLVERRWRVEVEERTLASGEVDRPVDPVEVWRAAEGLIREGVEAVAVCFLHSYRNPENERLAVTTIREAFGDLHVVASHEVAPVIREYERTVTTAACAFAQPIAAGYLDELESGLRGRGFTGRLLLMQSNGGAAAAPRVARVPIRLLESGPAGGVRAATEVARKRGEADLLCFDMGGTTAKACLVEGSQLQLLSELEVARVDRFKAGSGLPLHTSSVDLIEVGAGGGSIAATDRLGLLRVGPESAGADPGPACYGRGGTEPTVTDANLVLGYLGQESFLGGRMRLDRGAAEAAIARLAKRLGLDVTETAWGIHRLVNENMAAAARVHVIGRGRDPRRHVMLGFGGAGPAHAAAVGRLIGLSRIIVPIGAGATSAIGFLVSPAVHDAASSLPAVLRDVDWQEVVALYRRMEAEVVEALSEAGVRAADIEFERSADMRLLGQVHEVRVPVARLEHAGLEAAFAGIYRQQFSVLPAGTPVQTLTWRVEGRGPAPSLVGEWGHRVEGGRALKGERPVYFPQHGHVASPVFHRHSLEPGATLAGPAIIEEDEATTVVGPGDRFQVDPDGNLVIDLAEQRNG
jgi:5-oxoprolinase (ATP-hydrolysing)/N-methylhydantoinase A